MTFLILSFVAGALTILAPCILPLLPVIVGRSITDTTLSKRRVLVVTLSLGASVVLFTLILKASTLLIDIPQDTWKYISGGIIFVFGIVTLFPSLWDRLSFNSKISAESNKILMEGYNKNNIWGDIIIGASLGPIFSACSPTYFVILATVLPASPVLGFIYLLTYALGLCLALFVVAILGQKIATRFGVVSDSHGWFKKTLGIIFIIVSIGILTGYDKKLQTSILDAGFLDVTKIEQKFLDEPKDTITPEAVVEEEQQVETTSPEAEKQMNFLTPAEKKRKFILAPDLSTIDGYINTNGKEITISQYLGKNPVLLDIWTYSCINCQRTLPYLNGWYEKYSKEGLVIIGLHTPEFAFEHVFKNVESAVKKFGVKYPVVLDNDFSTWAAYKNQYWPRKYLIDIDGFIVYDHAGEGAYQETENRIKDVLAERAYRLNLSQTTKVDMTNPEDVMQVDFTKIKSPEIYFGSWRNEQLANGKTYTIGTQNLSIPNEIYKNKLYLGGKWDIQKEYASGGVGSEIVFKYESKNVYMVASGSPGTQIEIYLDDQLQKTISINEEALYDLIKGNDYGIHTLKIKVKSGTLEAFTFTFG